MPWWEVVVNGVCGVSSSGSCSEPRLQISLCGFTAGSAAIGNSFSRFYARLLFWPAMRFQSDPLLLFRVLTVANEEQDTESPYIVYIFNLSLA